jgi:hypothetical protein
MDMSHERRRFNYSLNEKGNPKGLGIVYNLKERIQGNCMPYRDEQREYRIFG